MKPSERLEILKDGDPLGFADSYGKISFDVHRILHTLKAVNPDANINFVDLIPYLRTNSDFGDLGAFREMLSGGDFMSHLYKESDETVEELLEETVSARPTSGALIARISLRSSRWRTPTPISIDPDLIDVSTGILDLVGDPKQNLYLAPVSPDEDATIELNRANQHISAFDADPGLCLNALGFYVKVRRGPGSFHAPVSSVHLHPGQFIHN